MKTDRYRHTGLLVSHWKEQNFAICSNMDGLGGYYAKEISQTEKNKYCITYMWNLKDTTD